jgi:predicted nuclease of predicted toxin-antitoxin system
MKLPIDVNLSPRWVPTLAEAGIEAEHWSRLGDPKAIDADIMTFAREKDYVILTHDLDFSAILAASKREKPSVIQIRSEDVSPERIGDPVIKAIRQMSDLLERGALLTVDPARARLRVLPLE